MTKIAQWLWDAAFGPFPIPLNLPGVLVWVLFGNHDDGPYGFLAEDGHPPYDWKLALKWWTRNPLHNLFFYVIAFPLWWNITLLGRTNGGYMPAARPGGILMLAPFPFICIQTKAWTFYIGFRAQVQRKIGNRPIGAFGIAFRRK